MLRIEVVQMGDDGDVESRLHNKGRDQCFLECPLGWVLALRLRKDDCQTMSAHGLQAFPFTFPPSTSAASPPSSRQETHSIQPSVAGGPCRLPSRKARRRRRGPP